MKRLGYLIAATAFVFLFAACSSGGSSEEPDTGPPPSDASADVTPDGVVTPDAEDTVDTGTPPDIADVPDQGPPPDQVTPPDAADVDVFVPPSCTVDGDCDPEDDYVPPLTECELPRCIELQCQRERKDDPDIEDNYCDQQFPAAGECDLIFCEPRTGECVLEPLIGCPTPCEDNPEICDDANPCTSDECQGDSGCVYAPSVGGDCDDDNPCTAGDTCVAYGAANARCAAGDWVNCDDSDNCTLDWCDPTDTDGDPCQHQPLDPCELPCETDADCPTVPDPCREYDCRTDAENPYCELVNTSARCDDRNVCTIGDTCADGACQPGETVQECDDGDFCTRDSCHPVNGCEFVATPDCRVPCESDADCEALSTNPCVDAFCDGAGLCRSVDRNATCNDGDPCTVDDRCFEGACVAGQPKNCDDGDPTTRDTCDPAVPGGCVHVPQPLCGPEGCGIGGIDCCTTGSDCNDGDPCTIDSCLAFLSPSLCICEPVPACSCNPNSADGGAGACDDGDPCTNDTCVPNSDPTIPHGGLCLHEYDDERCCPSTCDLEGDGSECDDGNDCTQDSCVPNTEGIGGCCTNEAFPFPCGRDCTRTQQEDPLCRYDDECVRGFCSADGKCEPPVNDPSLCECTEATVADDCAALIAVHASNVCIDVECIDRQCEPVFTTARCADADACAINSRCNNGECQGESRVCDDGDECTTDSCDPASGCVYLFDPTEPGCDVSCTGDEDCNDHDPCTLDVCTNPGTATSACQHTETPFPGCVQLPCTDDAWCDDGNPCTTDSCQKGRTVDGGYVEDPVAEHACIYAVVPDCSPDASLVCTEDAGCDPADCIPDEESDFPFCVFDPFCVRETCDLTAGCMFIPGPDCLIGCRPDIPDFCEDGNPCTVNTCNATTQACEEAPWPDFPGDPVYGDMCVACETADDCYAPAGWDSPRFEDCFVVRCEFPIEGLRLGICLTSLDLYPNACEDYEVCTTDSCAPRGCSNINVIPNCERCAGDADCDDQNACTRDVCEPSGLTCSHTAIPGCTPCTVDANCETELCSLQRCDAGRCVDTFLAGAGNCDGAAGCTSIDAPTCTSGLPGNFIGFCDVTSGSCLAAPDYEDPGNECETIEDCFSLNECRIPTTCTGNTCVFTDAPDCTPRTCAVRADCDDDNSCTIDLCTPFGCISLEDGECCETNSDCATGEPFVTGCLARACSTTNTCVDVGVGDHLRCSGTQCTADADCTPEAASYGPNGSLSADWACSQGACDMLAQRCVYFDGDCLGCSGDADCIDADPCTEDSCTDGVCSHTPIPACTPAACDATDICDSGDPCEVGVCLQAGCIYVPNPRCP